MKHKPQLHFLAIVLVQACGGGSGPGTEGPSILGSWGTFVYSAGQPGVEACQFTLQLSADSRYAASYHCFTSSRDLTSVVHAEVGTYSLQPSSITLAAQHSSCSKAGTSIETYAYELDDIGWRLNLRVPAAGGGGFPRVTVGAAGHLQLSGSDGIFDMEHSGGGPYSTTQNSFGCFLPNGGFEKDGGNLSPQDLELIYQDG